MRIINNDVELGYDLCVIALEKIINLESLNEFNWYEKFLIKISIFFIKGDIRRYASYLKDVRQDVINSYFNCKNCNK